MRIPIVGSRKAVDIDCRARLVDGESSRNICRSIVVRVTCLRCRYRAGTGASDGNSAAIGTAGSAVTARRERYRITRSSAGCAHGERRIAVSLVAKRAKRNQLIRLGDVEGLINVWRRIVVTVATL